MVEAYAGAAVRHVLQWHIAQLCWHPKQASLTQVYTAVGPALIKAKASGRYYQSVAREQAPDLHCRNESLQAQLWEATEGLFGDV